jgi:hypothetical protein
MILIVTQRFFIVYSVFLIKWEQIHSLYHRQTPIKMLDGPVYSTYVGSFGE